MCRGIARQVFVIGQHAHIPALQKLAKCTSILTVSDDSNGFAANFNPAVLLPIPTPIPHTAICSGYLSYKSEQHAERMFSNCAGIAFRCTEYLYPHFPGCLQIDDIEATAQSGYPAE